MAFAMSMAVRGVVLGVVCTVAHGCAFRAAVPEPTPVVDIYAAALGRGDAETIYGLMSEESRRAMSLDDLRRVLAEQRAELGDHAAGLESAERVVSARAEVRFEDGEIVTLDLEDGGFRVTAADALPAAAQTPEQALGQLRRVLARRSYSGLLRVLSPRTRAAIEQDLRTLVDGLDEPGSLDIEIIGDRATVVIPGGHQVILKREEGRWHVDDFR